MAKLQRITRSNGSTIYHVNIPESLINEIEWAKGDEIDCSTTKHATNNKTTITLEKVN